MTPVVLRLRELREAAELTQQQLAAKAGVRQATISDLERGVSQRIDLPILDRIAKVLKVEPGDLFEQTRR